MLIALFTSHKTKRTLFIVKTLSFYPFCLKNSLVGVDSSKFLFPNFLLVFWFSFDVKNILNVINKARNILDSNS